MPNWQDYKGIEVPFADPKDDAGERLKDDLLRLADRMIAGVCQGRLTLESGVPVSTTDQTAKTTVFFTPYEGSEVGLYDGSTWVLYDFSERSIAIPSVKFMTFDVFLYDNNGTLTLETVDWASPQTTGSITGATNASPIVITSNAHGLSDGDLVGIDGVGGNTAPNGFVWTVANVTTNTFELEGSTGNGTYTSGGTWYLNPISRPTAIVLQDGVYVQSGAADRRYLGTCRTTDISGQCEDSEARRFVWNQSNRVCRTLLVQELSPLWGLTSTSYQAANNSIANRVAAVIGLPGALAQIRVIATANITTDPVTNQVIMVGIGEDKTSGNDADAFGSGGSATLFSILAALDRYPAIGFHYYQWVERIFNGTGTVYGKGILNFAQSAIYGTIEA